jgi:hypothetical protein
MSLLEIYKRNFSALKVQNGSDLQSSLPVPVKLTVIIIKGTKIKDYEIGGSCSTNGEGRFIYRDLFGRPEGKRPLGRPMRMCENNIKINLREIGIDETKWIRLAQDRV